MSGLWKFLCVSNYINDSLPFRSHAQVHIHGHIHMTAISQTKSDASKAQDAFGLAMREFTECKDFIE